MRAREWEWPGSRVGVAAGVVSARVEKEYLLGMDV